MRLFSDKLFFVIVLLSVATCRTTNERKQSLEKDIKGEYGDYILSLYQDPSVKFEFSSLDLALSRNGYDRERNCIKLLDVQKSEGDVAFGVGFYIENCRTGKFDSPVFWVLLELNGQDNISTGRASASNKYNIIQVDRDGHKSKPLGYASLENYDGSKKILKIYNLCTDGYMDYAKACDLIIRNGILTTLKIK